MVDADEHIRPDTTLEQLADLRPILGREDPGATVTAGNASGQNDAAALCVVTTRDHAESLGLQPLLALRSWALAGVAPETMGIGPVPAVRRLLDQTGTTLDDLSVIEMNEAFAAQALAVTRDLGLPDDADFVNPNGGAIALGHPLGMSGAVS